MKSFFNILLSIGVSIFGGFILAQMWSWFIAPKFGLPHLSIVEAVGISTVINFMLMGLHINTMWNEVKEKHSELNDGTLGIIKTVVTGVFIYPLCLLGAYVWHLFL